MVRRRVRPARCRIPFTIGHGGIALAPSEEHKSKIPNNSLMSSPPRHHPARWHSKRMMLALAEEPSGRIRRPLLRGRGIWNRVGVAPAVASRARRSSRAAWMKGYCRTVHLPETAFEGVSEQQIQPETPTKHPKHGSGVVGGWLSGRRVGKHHHLCLWSLLSPISPASAAGAAALHCCRTETGNICLAV